MIHWCIKHKYFFAKSLILTFVRKKSCYSNKIIWFRIFFKDTLLLCKLQDHGRRIVYQSNIFGKLYGHNSYTFLLFSLCCPGNNNTSSVESNIFAKNVDVFLPFELQSECQIYLWKEKYKCGLWLLATKYILYHCCDTFLFDLQEQ